MNGLMGEHERNHPEWEPVYRDAMQETNHREVIAKINAAIPLLRDRLQTLGISPEDEIEREEVALALRALDVRFHLAARCCPGCWSRAEMSNVIYV